MLVSCRVVVVVEDEFGSAITSSFGIPWERPANVAIAASGERVATQSCDGSAAQDVGNALGVRASERSTAP